MARLTRLRLTCFRSYAVAELRFSGRVVAFAGPNGAGKTNLLEAISLLAPGRGLRGARIPDLLRRGDPHWAVSGEFSDATAGFEIGTGTTAETGPDRRAFRLDGEKLRSQAELAERVAMVWLTPQMDRLFTEPASHRRRFLDRLVLALEPGHARQVNGYETAMAHRNRLLAEGGADPVWLAALEDRMASHGIAVAAARRSLVARLASALAEGTGGAFPAATLVLQCPADALLDTMPALAAEDSLRASLATGRARDAAAGATLIGPHRADLLLSHAGKDMPAQLCSTGEQKALLVATVLAHAGLIAALRGQAPLLLLDEVAAHLDAERRAALLVALAALPGQSFLTGTDPEALSGTESGSGTAGVEKFRVENGMVRPEPLPLRD